MCRVSVRVSTLDEIQTNDYIFMTTQIHLLIIKYSCIFKSFQLKGIFIWQLLYIVMRHFPINCLIILKSQLRYLFYFTACLTSHTNSTPLPSVSLLVALQRPWTSKLQSLVIYHIHTHTLER